MFRPDRGPSIAGGRSSTGVASDVELSRLESQDCPLLSLEPSVNVRPVWMSQEESDLCRDNEVELRCCLDMDLWPRPLDEVALAGTLFSSVPNGVWIVTNDLFFFRVREFARLGRRLPGRLLRSLRSSFLLRMPPGLGKLAM